MTATSTQRTVAMMGCLLGLIAIRFLAPVVGLTAIENDILFVIFGALAAWIIKPAPYSIVGLLLLVAFWGLGLEPAIIFSGFSANGFFFFFGVLLLSRIITGVDLHLAIADLVVSRVYNVWTLVIATPFVLFLMALPVPSATARTLALKPIFRSLVDTGTNAGIHVMLSLGAVNRIGGRAYLSGGLAAILTVSVLDQYGYALTWTDWLVHMWVPALLLVVLSTAGITLLYNDGIDAILYDSVLVTDPDVGFDEPFFDRDRTVVVALLALVIVAWIGSSFVGIPEFVPLIALLSVAFFAPVRVADERTLQGLNWDLLVFFGAALSLPPVLAETNIGAFLVQDILGNILGPSLSFPVFLAGLICILVLLRILLIGATFVIIVLPLVIQLAAATGHDPLIVTFVSIIAGSVVFFPIQTPATMVAFEGRYLTQRDTALAGFAILVATFITTYVSVYLYWPQL
jgi:sodium-dependent dicarboxylate transporter 2/3/5